MMMIVENGIPNGIGKIRKQKDPNWIGKTDDHEDPESVGRWRRDPERIGKS